MRIIARLTMRVVGRRDCFLEDSYSLSTKTSDGALLEFGFNHLICN